METRGLVPEPAPACRSFAESGDDPHAELFACKASMRALPDPDVAGAAYAAAVVLVGVQ